MTSESTFSVFDNPKKERDDHDDHAQRIQWQAFSERTGEGIILCKCHGMWTTNFLDILERSHVYLVFFLEMI